MRLHCTWAVFFCAAMASLASAQPAPRGPDGFANNYPHLEKESFWSWQWERMRDGLPKSPPGGWNLPAVKTDPVVRAGAALEQAPARRDANQTLWGGWVVEGEGLRLIHTGDTGYSKDFRDIGERLGPFDMAFIPIGSYAPRWFMKVMHVDIPEAVQIRADLKAARAIGMHWGTFESLADEPLDEPPVVLARQRQERGLTPDQFDVLKIGETRRLESMVPSGAVRAATP